MLGVSRGFDEVHLIYRLKHEINSLSPDAAHFLQQWERVTGLGAKGCVLSICAGRHTAALVMTPWVARNIDISGRFVPTMTVTGLAIFPREEAERNAGSGKDSKDLLDDAAEEQVRIGHEMGLRMREEFFLQFYRFQDEVSFYDELSRRGWTRYREHPALLMRTIVHNCWAFWFQGRTYKATLINIVVMLPLSLSRFVEG